MQNIRCRVATLALWISALAFPTNRGHVIADNPKGDERREAALREGMTLLLSSAIESALKQAIEESMRTLELNDPIEKGIYFAALSSEHRGTALVRHSTASIVLMRPAYDRESQKTFKDSGGNLDVVLTKIRTRNVKSETATVAIVEEVEGGYDVEQSSFVYDSKQGWRKVETAVSSHRHPAK
jgi:hypothetical protein